MWTWKSANQAWHKSWETDPRGRTSFRYTQSPSKKVLRLHKDRERRESALFVQMRTEKKGLRDFLYSRKIPGILDARCECGEAAIRWRTSS
jgi:tubulin alpha